MRNNQHQTPQNLKHRVSNRYLSQYSKQQPDVYLILMNKIFPLHSKFLKQSKYITDKISEDEKVLIISFQLDISSFQKIIKFLYTSEFCFQRDQTILQVIQIAKQLQIQKLQQLLKQDFINNFEQYSIFLLYNIAQSFNYQLLNSKCQQELLALEFHQININRSSLYELDQKMFEQIIKIHQKLKSNKQITGLSTNEIAQIIQQYSEYSGFKVSIQQLVQADIQSFQIDSDRLKTPKLKKMMTLSSNGSALNSSPLYKNAFKSLIIPKKSFQNKDKIKQIILSQLNKEGNNMERLINQLNESLSCEVESNGSNVSMSDQSNKGKFGASSYKQPMNETKVMKFKYLESSDQISLKDLEQFASCKNLSQKQFRDKSTQQRTETQIKSVSHQFKQYLRIPQIQKNSNF